MNGYVYLVGAGCGQADLITLRGRRALESCDTVLYDELIDGALLDLAPEAEKINMGKRSGRHSASQEEICAALIAAARAGKTVVRLKGGDPLVFGRGGEEALALQEAGIAYEVIPGITSAVAIPAAAGIPVTHRGLSRGFHVVTGHTAGTADGLPEELDELAKLRETLVILMGLSQLEAITRRLLAAGMDGRTPAAVLSGGNAPCPATVRGTLANIARKAADVCPPAVIVIGETAGLDLRSPLALPLTGKTVALTGTEAVTEKLRPLLERQGARCFSAMRGAVRELPAALDPASLGIGRGSWLVFTSGNGVRVFFRGLTRQGLDIRAFAGCRFAVIGSATAKTLAEYGVRADLVPPRYTSESLAGALLEAAGPEDTFILLRSRQGARSLAEALSASHRVRDIWTYDVEPEPITEEARSRMPLADYLVFNSGGGVEMFFRQWGALPERAVSVCIGEVCARALRARTDRPFLVAPEISAGGIVSCILAHAGAGEK